jgi:hypothetical protein
MRIRLALLGLLTTTASCSQIDLCYLNPSLCGQDAGFEKDARSDSEDEGATQDGSRSDGGGGFCAMQNDAGYLLCSDFDPPAQTVMGDFETIASVGSHGGTFSLSKIHVSAPYGALGVANPFPAGGTTGVYFMSTLWTESTPHSLRCSLEWNPQALSHVPNDFGRVVSIGLGRGSGDAGTEPNTLDLNMLASGELVMVEYYPSFPSSVTHDITSAITTKRWYAVELAVTPPSKYLVTVTGEGSVDTSIQGQLKYPIPSTSVGTIDVGPAYYDESTTEESPGWSFDYDNIVCR